MEKMNAQPRSFNSLADIRAYKDEIHDQIRQDEDRIGILWSDLFHPVEEERPNTPTKRIAHMVSMGTGIIDGILLGWKLYRKYQGATSFFSKRKRRH